MVDIHHKMRIEAPVEKVFEALTTLSGLSKWWTKWTTFEKGAGEPGSVIRFGFSENGMASKFEIVGIEKNKKVEWKNIDEPGEWSWNGTKIIFSLNEEVVEFYDNKKMVSVSLSHIGFKEVNDFYSECNSRWGFFLLSLKDSLEKGKGSPIPDDIYM